MLTIIWIPRGFHLMNGLAKGCKFNNNHYTTEILLRLSEWRSVEVQESNRKLIMHTDNDNAPLHTGRATTDFVE
jgi:hypothetical protein